MSIRNADEARIALQENVDWIDLKEPHQGPLGAPSLETARGVASVLVDHPSRSVALGELSHLDFELAFELSKLFPVLKVGLSDINEGSTWKDRWQSEFTKLVEMLHTSLESSGQNSAQGTNIPPAIVPVIYADWEQCGAVAPAEVVDFVRTCDSTSRLPFVLIDTHQKLGLTLLDHFSVSEIKCLAQDLKLEGCKLIVAGSLRSSDFESLSTLPIEAIGVRGAVCVAGREGKISRELLNECVDWFAAS